MVVGIICEYNPFHYGHTYHLSKIREEFGENTVVVGLMSGNALQRGQLAFLDKYERAKTAVQCGVDLVLEIPFPFSASSAEYYAKAGVALAKSLKVDVLSFGSECGDIIKLTSVFNNMQTTEYKIAFKKAISEKKSAGYPKLQESVYSSLFGNEDLDILSSPNNTLALEYIKALNNTGIKPHTVKRVGSSYHDTSLSDTEFSSATAIRKAVLHGDDVSAFVPPSVFTALSKQKTLGHIDASLERVSSSILHSFLINSSDTSFAECEDGLYKRLQNIAFEVTSYSSLCAKSATKKYTDNRIRRAILFSYLGVTSSDLKNPVAMTHLLGANTRGLSHLKRVKAESDFPILTKPSAFAVLTPLSRRQKDLTDSLDVIFGQSLPCPTSADLVWRKTPYIEK